MFLEIGDRCQVTMTSLWCGGEKKKTKWEELSIRPACEALKKRCERKLTQGDKNEGRSNYIWGKKKKYIYIYILIIKDTKNSGRE